MKLAIRRTTNFFVKKNTFENDNVLAVDKERTSCWLSFKKSFSVLTRSYSLQRVVPHRAKLSLVVPVFGLPNVMNKGSSRRMLENFAVLLSKQPADVPLRLEHVLVSLDDFRAVHYNLSQLHAIGEHHLEKSHQ